MPFVDSQEILKNHSDYSAAIEILQILKKQGYETYFAGGCVRDLLLGRIPHDVDIATKAPPEMVEKLFQKTISVGKVFGVIRVLDFGADIEVASFRKDGLYVDGRRPQEIIFSTPEEDAHRRDFTMNALFFDPLSGQVIDFVGGVSDIQNRHIRAVGNAKARFQEDHLRILRGIRFLAEIDFEIEPETFQAIRESVPLIKTVSWERIGQELTRILMAPHRQKALELMKDLGFFDQLFSGLECRTILQGNSIEEAWLELFFLNFSSGKLSTKDFQLLMDRWKFSGELKKYMLEAMRFMQDWGSFQGFSRAEKFLALKSKGARAALSVFASIDVEAQQIFLQLKQDPYWESLPSPWFSGEDLKVYAQGSGLGELLKQVYLRQLDGNFNSKEQALDWVRKRSFGE